MWGFFVFIYVRDSIKKILSEEIVNGGHVLCDNCGWSWKLSDGGNDKYICHKCGHDNTPKKSNFDKVIDSIAKDIPNDVSKKVKDFVKSYIQQKGYTVKFLNSCSTGFSGVRTQNQIIICSPNLMTSFGDFIYTIFHELRHEEQMTSLKMTNPFVEMDLNDFEKLNDQYWKMEMDADQFAKKMVTTIVQNLGLPSDKSKKYFQLSKQIEDYQYASNMVKTYIQHLVMDIIRMKKDGVEFNDIQDHPFVKRHLDKLEDFI